MVVVQTNPFWTAVLAYFLNNELLSKFEIGGMLISFLGVMAISLSNPSEDSSHDSGDTK